ncbi:PREDICTED: G-protein coupled receptor 98-like [Priapulus caudatus]|uniref:G-protein coupled receptor 98-like n=1 Tax=Priapulus caudatus TaxID=37621 RepID=A0ABM1DST4_PRICU|nr:PREDICTED: G-protein coupled receptor 98-like [Priapulus caudatus]XP_014663004.1 PREDICTED: G-protein coupled receptor 98-like [Priapulus caudatus]XP_014663005.1 PREDICTED: G-protein coupled receptor 98-like [Priapulus caudatus]
MSCKLLAGLCLLGAILTSCAGEAIVSLDPVPLYVDEGVQFNVTVRKAGENSAPFYVVVLIANATASNDFAGTSQVVEFDQGSGPVVKHATFTPFDDHIPEKEEQFRVELRAQAPRNIAKVVEPSSGTVVIRASDDAYGQFRFLQTDPVTVTESPSGPTPVVFTVQRDGGTFDNVTVNYQVFAEDGSEDVADDISPAQGSILFRAGEKNLLLTLYVQPDDLPENTETFRVVLNSASGGASINPAANKTEVPIIISANDAPLRFAQSTFAVDELGGTHDIEIDVLRGLEMDGVTPTGPVQGGASVLLSVIAGSAHEGLDYIARNQSLTFSGGVTRQKFRVTILKDDIPENAENFKVMLSHPGGDAVIAEPSKMNVIIKSNDDHNGVLSFLSPVTGKSPALTVSEDSAPSVELTVLRGGGSFGTVTVQWEVIRTDNDNDPVSADMNPTGGRLTFYEGEKEKVIRFSVNQDSQPEPAEHFLVRLLPGSVTGGARLQNPSETSLFVLDSDDAHGLVEFGPNSLQTLNTAATVRHLSLLLVRGGGSFGNISVDFVADYYPDHNTDKTESGVLGTFACSGCHAASPIVLADGQTSTIFTIPIMDTAFLRVGGRFDVTLSRASRVPPVPGSLSPRIGHKDRASIPVPAALANGEIGFTSVETIYVNEPDDKPLMVPLEVSREGLAGDAYVVWRSHSSQDKDGRSTSKDNGNRNGTVLIKSGSNMGYINIKIMPDNVPETDEEITVNLISVQPANQKLRENARQVKVVVRENDAPGGSFQFSPAMNLSYLLEEDGPALEVAVERSGGMLVKREVQIFISPSSDQKNEADEEFYGGTNVLKFEAGERFKTATVVAVPDGIPELDEEYVLQLISYGEKVSDIGPKSAINITISKNDDPYGMFHFDASALRHTIGESKGNNTIRAEFTVMRDRGKFSPVTLKWHVLPKGNTDVTPLNGTVSFQDGQSAATMLLSSAPDEIPEDDENFTIVLEEPDASMEYRLTAPTSAVLTVKKNDDPVFFADPVNKFAEEPGVVQFTVRRNGSIEHPASIRYRTIPGTAIANQDYMAIDGDLLVFPAGVYERAISVVVRDDEEPENDEIFYIELFGAEGDVVAYTPKANATVMILANDDANGVFRFVPPLIITATEGETLKFGIQRFAGNFGAAQLWWHIVENGTNNEIPRETDFRPVSGFVRFLDQEVEKHFSVDVLADGTPEHDEYFDVKLHNVTGYGPSGQEGRLADEHLRVTVKVFGNDDPYGIFMFDPDTRDQYIAEDFYPGSEDSTVTNLTVVRLQGAYSTVQVLWEVFSDAIAGDLPAAKDLLFLGDYPETVTERPDMRRPLTGTKVLQFSGSQGDYVTISQQYQPLISDIETGFSVSTWIQPVAPQDGYIFAKTSDDGAKHYYTLHLEADTIQFKVTFGYSLMNSKQDGLTHRTLYWSERKNLCDGKWHQILIMLARGEAEFYLNGYFVGRKLTGTTRVIDESGTLLVGGIVPGDVSTYEGLMQDVRVYNRRLDPGEIEELSRAPARKDVKPVSGYLTFLPGVASHMLQLESVQDNEDEGNEVFAVKLLSARGGARITRDDGIGKVTVLKSDNANGLFGFEGDCTPSLAQSEGVDVVCTVQRSFGDEGVVTVHWTVMQWNETAGTYFNGSDFSETSGVLEFLPGERTQRLNLRVVDDAVPETVEVFHVRLVEATSDDGVAGTTNMSGASIDPRGSYSTVTVEANDFPYGLLQFMAGNASRVVGGLIVPATESQQIRTTEEIATLPITIERAQGLLGEISVEWRTVDGTAVSSGKVPPDFQRSSSSAVFQPGVQYRTINITILDNDLPEGEKEFQVELLNPTGGAQIGVGSTIKVIIASSDDAYGMFQFADTSLSVQGQELTDIGSTPIHLTVHRLGGTIGQCYWCTG